jgi:hypothetical protein
MCIKTGNSREELRLRIFMRRKKLVARPRKKVTKQRVALTISPDLLAAAKAYAYEIGESLSGLIEKLLTATVGPTGNHNTAAKDNSREK